VQLDDIYIDGLIHITALGNDYFQFDAAKGRLIGERTNRSYRLGDKMNVVVVRVDVDEGRIDLELADKPEAKTESEKKPLSGRDKFMSKKPKKGTNKHGTAKRGKTTSRNKNRKKSVKKSKAANKTMSS
jgi:ribonuclease R